MSSWGFNPCFTGSPTSTKSNWAKVLYEGLFQSLFYWKSYFNAISRNIIIQPIAVSILVLLEVLLQRWHETIYSHVPYVSILVLLEVLLQRIEKRFCTLEENLFQSLFYWKSYFNVNRQKTVLIIIVCFNPCFTGSPTSTVSPNLVYSDKIGVSILVLLEVLLQLKDILDILNRLESFNPCFTGSPTSTCEL